MKTSGWTWAAALVAAWLLAGCGGGGTAAPADAGGTDTATMSAQAALGRRIFDDVSLSASGRQACASCHSADFGHAAPNALAVQLGGPLLDQEGRRASPSIRYLSTNTAFHFDDEGTPTGGFFWDGRATSLQDQAARPFVSSFEMANASVQEVIDKLSRAAYADEFKRVFGADIFSRPDDAFDRMTLALQQFQREDTALRAFSSKYDEFLRGKASLTEQELRGLALFNRPDKGNCAACHPSAKAADGSHPLFTDFSYDNLGVPRNTELARNTEPNVFDLGLCAREGGDLVDRTDLCGAFKVPTLRNVALRQAFFHNGRFKTLKDTLTFYVQRDIHPEKFYPLDADGTVRKFDDLPPGFHANVNTSEAPYDRKPGDAPALSDAEIDDVIAFLRTLTDGYQP
ncbi:MAG TPA: cytochrome c peroxidase [Albitalea sp.]|uniref:cytochrome-c peroxidase n=1 Tax=Piscinibacter sp. TaxID=1903157 RepID=UPI002ED255B8